MSLIGEQESGPYPHLLELARISAQGLEALEGFILEPDAGKEAQVRILAASADSSLKSLDASAGAGEDPLLDPEDAFKLSRALAGLMEAARLTSGEMLRFSVPANGSLREISGTLRTASAELHEAVKTLCGRPRDCEEHVLRAKKAAGYAEKVRRGALDGLLKGSGTVDILKARGIYGRLSEAAGRCDEAAELLGDVLVKTR